MTLDTRPRLADPDALYAALVEAHRGLTPRPRAGWMRSWCCCWPTTSATAVLLEAIAEARRARTDAP